eukprot:921743_1
MSENSNPRKRRKRGNELGGIWPRLFAVGAFAWALYLRKGGANPCLASPNDKTKSKTTQNKSNLSKPNRPVLQPEATAQPEPPPNTDLTDFQIDSSKFSKPLKELSQPELRQLAGHNLGRIFDESRGGHKWEDDEVGFVFFLRRACVPWNDIAFSVNRSSASVSKKIRAETSVGYCPSASKTGRKARTRYIPSIPDRVAIVGRHLPNHQGTTKDIFDLIEAKYNDMDHSATPGHKIAGRGLHLVKCGCALSPWFRRIGKVGKQALWQYLETEDTKGMTKAYDESMLPSKKHKRDKSASSMMNYGKACRKG